MKQPLTADELMIKDQEVQTHYRNKLIAKEYTPEVFKQKMDTWTKVFRHQLYQIIDN